MTTPAAVGALSTVIIAWIRRNNKRSVEIIIQGGKLESIKAQGYCAEDVKQILTEATRHSDSAEARLYFKNAQENDTNPV